MCVCARCHTAKLRYQLYLMFSNFLIYPSCYFRFAFVCVDRPQTQTVVHTHTHTHIHTVPTENKHFQRNKKHRKNDKHWNEILRFLQQAQHVCIVLVCSCISLYMCVCVWLRDFQWHFLLSRLLARLATKTRILLAIFVVLDSIYIDIAIYVRVIDKLFD